MTTASLAGARAARKHSPLIDIWVLAVRNLKKVVRVPQLVFFSLVQPVVFLTLFSQVFRTVAETPFFQKQYPGVDYIDFLLPAVLTTTVAMNATNSGVGMANDLSTGVIDRFRSMPVADTAVYWARSFSDLARASFQVVFMLVVGMVLFGFRFHGTTLGAFGMFAVILPLNWALTWWFLALGTSTKNVETTQLAGFLFLFPLMFASSAYVPVKELPGWLQAIADVNPLSFTIDAARGLALGLPGTGEHVRNAFVSAAVVAALGIALTVVAHKRSKQ